MSSDELVRLWKDPDAVEGRSDHPAGEIELAYGGATPTAVATEPVFTMGCCNGLTRDTCTIFYECTPITLPPITIE